MKIDHKQVSDFYNNTSEIWSKHDKWHYNTYLEIKEYLNNNIKIDNDSKILNAGSGGNSYGFESNNMTHLDIASKLILDKKNKIVGSIESIPLEANSFTNIICVGSVLNYCDPIKVISEFKRVLRNQGNLILEYENSKTLELLFSKDLNKKVVLKKTFYNNHEILLWYFSEQYIAQLLISNNFEILSIRRFHILSAFIYKVTKNVNFSSKFIILDSFFRKIPIIKKFSSNIILTACLNKANPN